jgi:dihydroorotate dehydrogenase electron transfer subunit
MADIIGPLGRGFTPGRGGRAVMVAGGLGIAPMPLLAKKLSSLGVPSILLYGCRDKGQLLATPGIKTAISTENGSCGRRGRVTDLLEERLRQGGACRVYACGPWAMLKQVSLVCREHKTPCQVSLEARMACGVGACQGCAVKAAGGGYLHVCSDGPVFDSRRIDWNQEPPV